MTIKGNLEARAVERRRIADAALGGSRTEKHAARLLGVLAEHWLAEVLCDHGTKTDAAICACGRWGSGALPSVGEAVAAWADHVVAQMYACRGEGCEVGGDPATGECAHARQGNALVRWSDAALDASARIYERGGRPAHIDTRIVGDAPLFADVTEDGAA